MRNIVLGTHAADLDAGVMLAKIMAGGSAAVPDAAEVDRFCELLNGYTFASFQHRLGNKDLTPLPTGYGNVRVFDAHDGTLLGSAWHLGSDMREDRAGFGFRVSAERPTAFTIGSICLCLPFEEVTAWRCTRSLPTSGNGTLDLAVDIDIRPRRAIIDGTPIPDHLVAFMNARARKHA